MSVTKETQNWSFSKNIIYEFTVNGCDHTQVGSFASLHVRYKRCRKLLREIMQESGVKYKLFPEISQPQYGRSGANEMARIHFHGIVRFPSGESILNWLLLTTPKLSKYGSYQFNTFRPDYWPGYCTKQMSLYRLLDGNYELENSFEFDSLFTCIMGNDYKSAVK